MADIDPQAMAELTACMSGGLPDREKIRRVLIKFPALKAVMAQFNPELTGGDGDGGGGGGSGYGPSGGSARASAQRGRLQELLKQKRDMTSSGSAKMMSPEKMQVPIPAATDDDDDDWLTTAQVPGSTKKSPSSSGKKKGGKKR
jgi:hypothetical protein